MMKKILAALVLALTGTTAVAHGPYYAPRVYYPRYHYHSDWIVPAIIGGAVVYGITQSRVAPPPPVVVQVPQAPVGYHYESILDANCNCYKTVLVPN
jgi:hypothetical protein